MAVHTDTSSPKIPFPQKGLRAPVRVFLGVAIVGAGVLLLLCMILFDLQQLGFGSLFSGFIFYLVASIITGRGLARYYTHDVLGLCNVVTFMRLVMVAVLVVALVGGVAQSWALFIFAICTLSLDGVDGWLARRQNLTSTFGARFDMEVDAIFALVLAVMAYRNGVAGAYVLLLGLPSYLFFVAKFGLPWLDQPLPDLFSRKVVCVAQLGVLIALQLPMDIAHLLGPLTLAVAAALIWSFGRDIVWLARARP